MSDPISCLLRWAERAMDHAGVPLREFLREPMRQDAVAFCLIALGELAKRTPRELREAHPDVPWSHMAKTRDFLAHHPMEVDPALLWDVAHRELPRIVKALTP